LRIAHDWGYLPKVPKIVMAKQPKKLPRYVTPEHFAAMVGACKAARMPHGQSYPASEWWQGLLLLLLYMTGWRISEALALRRDDVDQEQCTAITRAEDNKGGRDERIPLHPTVMDQLRTVRGFSPAAFNWPHDRRTLLAEFHRLQRQAEVSAPCHERHEHNEACLRYGFHDLRRVFATMNAARLTPDALQALMRRRSYLTTQRYINMGRQLDNAVAALHVPDMATSKAAGADRVRSVFGVLSYMRRRKSMRLAGLEPTTHGLKVRCSAS